MRPLYRRGHMDQVLLTFGFTFVFFDLVQTVWGRVGAAAAGAGDPAGHRADRRRGVLGLPAVPDRLRLCDRAAALAVSRAQPASAPWCAPASTTPQMAAGLGGNIPALFTGIFGVGVALAALGGVAAGPDARPLSRHGRRNPHPGLHRHRDRRHGQPARRLRRQPADRHRRHLRQGLFPEPRAVPDLSGDGARAAGAAAGPVRHQILRRLRPRRRSPPSARRPRRRRASPGWSRSLAMLVLPFAGVGLPARAGRRDLHLRDLRHEPRPAARLHRPDVARPRRLLRAGRLRAWRCSGTHVRRQRLARRSSAGVVARRRRRRR